MSHEGTPAAAGGRAVAAGPQISLDLLSPAKMRHSGTLKRGSSAVLPAGGQKCRAPRGPRPRSSSGAIPHPRPNMQFAGAHTRAAEREGQGFWDVAGSGLMPPFGSGRLEWSRPAMPTRVDRVFSEEPAGLPAKTAPDVGGPWILR